MGGARYRSLAATFILGVAAFFMGYDVHSSRLSGGGGKGGKYDVKGMGWSIDL